jgi:hypothetical protein
VCAGNPAVSVNGTNLCSWSFDAMNVLTWAEEAGVASAWLQFMALPGGSIFMGALKTPDSPEDTGAAIHLDSHAQQSDFVNPNCGQERSTHGRLLYCQAGCIQVVLLNDTHHLLGHPAWRVGSHPLRDLQFHGRLLSLIPPSAAIGLICSSMCRAAAQ